jgi:hypothetical protein
VIAFGQVGYRRSLVAVPPEHQQGSLESFIEVKFPWSPQHCSTHFHGLRVTILMAVSILSR